MAFFTEPIESKKRLVALCATCGFYAEVVWIERWFFDRFTWCVIWISEQNGRLSFFISSLFRLYEQPNCRHVRNFTLYHFDWSKNCKEKNFNPKNCENNILPTKKKTLKCIIPTKKKLTKKIEQKKIWEKQVQKWNETKEVKFIGWEWHCEENERKTWSSVIYRT